MKRGRKPRLRFRSPTCLSCSEPLTGRRQFMFCGCLCAISLFNSKRPKPKLNERKCLLCESQLTSKHQSKFCSRSCSAKYNNVGVDRHLSNRGEIVERQCLKCGNITTNKAYCSRNCKYASQTKYKTKEEAKKADRAIKREAWSRYMAKRRNQTPHDVDISALQKIYLNCPHGYEVDHIIPISRGGLHHPDNLQYLTKSDNRKKWKKLPSELAPAQGFEP